MRDKKLAPQVIEYLQMVRKVRGKPLKGFVHNGIGDLIMKNGEVFRPVPLPSEFRRGRMKECFRNAAEAALAEVGEWQYTEGVALVEGLIPVQHAWLSRNGLACDPTWTDGTEYVGIRFSNSLLTKVLLANKVYGLIDDWKNGYPMLKFGFNPALLEEFYESLLTSRRAGSGR